MCIRDSVRSALAEGCPTRHATGDTPHEYRVLETAFCIIFTAAFRAPRALRRFGEDRLAGAARPASRLSALETR
eukprot:2149980-Alexandrium_andersonii.AAC.1